MVKQRIVSGGSKYAGKCVEVSRLRSELGQATMLHTSIHKLLIVTLLVIPLILYSDHPSNLMLPVNVVCAYIYTY
jgi:hypothetical protein